MRCAIYTRKSSEEGLEQEFNSLDAQREACGAYIASQRHEGWRAVPTLYDDGAYSGGTMERPALQRLLADIRLRRVDVVVVYKVDRLTRSLTDFAKIVEVFDAHSVSFVSVTQAFNTTSSMGRLTLNVLLSFAQFEREVTGERIRDKIAASKQKGLWMGGLPSLGYDVKNRKLVVNEKEAATVRHMFERYVALGSVRELAAELDAGGVRSKSRVASGGRVYGAKRFSRGALYHMLQNRIYRGEIVHKAAAYKGEHAAIVEEELWSQAQRRLAGNRIDRRKGENGDRWGLLAGLLFDAADEPMTPSHAVKKGVRYRYYVSRRLTAGSRTDQTAGQRIPAASLERLIIERVRSFIGDPAAIHAAASEGRRDAPAQKKLGQAAATFSADWDRQPADTIQTLLRAIITRVRVHADRVDMAIDPIGVAKRLLTTGRLTDAEESHDPADDADRHATILSIPARLKRTGKELKFLVDGSSDPSPDASLLRLLAQAHQIGARAFATGAPTLDEIAKGANLSPSYATRLLRLTFLAPDIVAAIVVGRQPPDLTAHKLIADTRLPLDWRDQRIALGFG